MQAPEAPAARFRLRSKKLFLTYPKCPISPTRALEILLAIPATASATGHVIATEKHADGTDHLHAYLEASEPMLISSAHELDLATEDGTTYHGNYQAVRSSNRVKRYVTKEGNYVTNLELSSSATSENPWSKALELAKTEGTAEAISYLESESKTARDMCINGDRILKNLGGRMPKRLKISYELPSFGWNITWASEPATTTLLLYGATNLGKTALAKALLPDALLVRHLDKLRDYAGGKYKGIILDDMAFLHLHDEAQIALLDRDEDTQVHVRYTVAEIPAGTPVICTSNRYPGEVFNTTKGAIRRRLTIVHVSGIGNYALE